MSLNGLYWDWLHSNKYRDLNINLDTQWFQANGLIFNSYDKYLNFNTGFVYFIRFSGSWAKALIKVGFTSKIDKRFTELDEKYGYLMGNTSSIINIVECRYPYIAEQSFIKKLDRYKSDSAIHHDKEIFLVDWDVLKLLRRIKSIEVPQPSCIPQYTPKTFLDDIPF